MKMRRGRVLSELTASQSQSLSEVKVVELPAMRFSQAVSM